MAKEIEKMVDFLVTTILLGMNFLLNLYDKWQQFQYQWSFRINWA